MESTSTSLITTSSNIREWATGTACWLLIVVPLLLVTSCQKQKQPAPKTPSTPSVMNGPPGYLPPVMNKPYPATGVVVLINRQEGWIEINHDEIKGLMPAMQMEFWVKNKSLLDNAKAGDRVDFTIIETPKGEYLTELRRATSNSPSP